MGYPARACRHTSMATPTPTPTPAPLMQAYETLEVVVLQEVETALRRVDELTRVGSKLRRMRAILQFRHVRLSLGLRLILCRDPNRAASIPKEVRYVAYYRKTFAMYPSRDSLAEMACLVLDRVLRHPGSTDLHVEQRWLRWRVGPFCPMYRETDEWKDMDSQRIIPSRLIRLTPAFVCQRLRAPAPSVPFALGACLILEEHSGWWEWPFMICRHREIRETMIALLGKEKMTEAVVKSLSESILIANAHRLYRAWGLAGMPAIRLPPPHSSQELVPERRRLADYARVIEQMLALMGPSAGPIAGFRVRDGDRAVMQGVIRMLIEVRVG